MTTSIGAQLSKSNNRTLILRLTINALNRIEKTKYKTEIIMKIQCSYIVKYGYIQSVYYGLTYFKKCNNIRTTLSLIINGITT